ncbi:hypothetical protein Lalb_Chr19g0126371 [Lupinus albus]|uniref:Uncharacterized protein n=1 Tax=Lupinus albus TaxID=3870 RepID=A0A6A4P0M4_LUPAL|nr:hypothetical protein Lalb_Chr19g0126371 [Lupinus albus]
MKASLRSGSGFQWPSQDLLGTHSDPHMVVAGTTPRLTSCSEDPTRFTLWP